MGCRSAAGVAFVLGSWLMIAPGAARASAFVDLGSFWFLTFQGGTPPSASLTPFGNPSSLRLTDTIHYGKKTESISSTGGYYLTNTDAALTGTTVFLITTGSSESIGLGVGVTDSRKETATVHSFIEGFYLGDRYDCSTAGAGDINCIHYSVPPFGVIATPAFEGDNTGSEFIPVALPAPGERVELDFYSEIDAVLVAVPAPAMWPAWALLMGCAVPFARRRA